MDFINMLYSKIQKKWKYFLFFISHKLKFIIASFLVVIFFLCAVFFWMNKVNYVVLYNNLSDIDGKWVISKLKDMHVSYQFHRSSKKLLVPEDKVDELRFSLMNKKNVIKKNDGFKLLDKEKFGISQFHEHVNYHRGLEGELSQTLECIFPIQHARVHLVCKKDTDFFRDDQVPSASVVVTVFPDTQLTEEQIDAIALLISGSVPNLSADNIIVVNQFGNILNKCTLNYSRFFNNNKYKKINILEQYYCDHINNLLASMYGSKNFIVHVCAKIKKNNTIINKVKIKKNNTKDQSKKLLDNISDVFLNNKKNTISSSIIHKLFLMKKISTFITKKILMNNVSQINSTVKKKIINMNNYILSNNMNSVHNVNEKLINSNTTNDCADYFFPDFSKLDIQHLNITILINYKKNDAGIYIPFSFQELQDLEKLIKSVIDFSDHRGDCINIINYKFFSSHIISNHDIFSIYNYLNVNYLLFFCISFFFVFLFIYILYKNIIIDNKKKNSLTTVSNISKNSKNYHRVSTDKLNYKKNDCIDKDHCFIKHDFLDKHPKIIEQVIRYWINKK
ncbi:flagellar basal-body MS-ring/collar protein FliF [Buchnera aphidicola]|uniref:Flagellar M-ring protein n=1 Tax=Buchnera aphidicola (Cinara cf. splendens/pseudotsugae 3390) TaxID=2518980 RepID=A0A451CWD5_9GAMM|nr:flagellar basal-body MS-ring/collar protein FliF [Buchnera aphidicola]VFP77614.1 Flagellar M-ring protein [Buchnera aphidicola (Cinara cf. splendens/pseudotsugae 3390)]